MVQDKNKKAKYQFEMDERTPYLEIIFQTTVPIISQDLIIPLAKHVGFTVSNCSLTFPVSNFNSTATLRMRTVQTAGRNSRILVVKFGSIKAVGSPWRGYTVPKLPV